MCRCNSKPYKHCFILFDSNLSGYEQVKKSRFCWDIYGPSNITHTLYWLNYCYTNKLNLVNDILKYTKRCTTQIEESPPRGP